MLQRIDDDPRVLSSETDLTVRRRSRSIRSA